MKPLPDCPDSQKKGGVPFRNARFRFPIIDFHYQIFSPDRFRSGSTGNSPSFFNISRDYFQREARRNFLAEIAFFVVIAAIFAAAFINGARAIIHFLHLPPA